MWIHVWICHNHLGVLARSRNTYTNLFWGLCTEPKLSKCCIKLQYNSITQWDTYFKHQSLLPPVLFNFTLKKITWETLLDHYTSLSISRRPISPYKICTLQTLNLTADCNIKLQDCIIRLTDIANAYGMRTSTNKTKVKARTVKQSSS